MIQAGKYYVALKRPDFGASSGLSGSDLSALVEAQRNQSKLIGTLSASVSNMGGSSVEVGNFIVLEMPLGSLGKLSDLQRSCNVLMPFGVGSTINGAYLALQVAEKYGKSMELYVPGKTENLFKNEEPISPEQDAEHAIQAELQAKAHQVSPEQFMGILTEFQVILQNFKANLPSIEILQITNPAAYSAILDVVNASSMFADSLLQSGILSPDLAVAAQQQAQMAAEQAMQEDGEGEAPPEDGDSEGDSEEESKKKTEEGSSEELKPNNQYPLGSIRPAARGFRIKVKNPDGTIGWKYASSGLGPDGAGGAGPAVGAGSRGGEVLPDEPGVEEPAEGE